MQAPPNGTFGAKLPNVVLRKLIAVYDRIQVRIYRRSGGTDRITRLWDFPVVVLTTKGARSGLTRTTALGGFANGDDSWLIMAVGVSATTRHPQWFLNMVRHPDDVWIEVGGRKSRVRGQLLAGPERAAALEHIASISSRYGKYQALTDRQIPVVQLTAERT